MSRNKIYFICVLLLKCSLTTQKPSNIPSPIKEFALFKFYEKTILTTNKELTELIEHQKEIASSFFDIITGGVKNILYKISFNLLFNNTPLFVRQDVLKQYGLYQQNRLINLLKKITYKNNPHLLPEDFQDFDIKNETEVIRDIGLDSLAFGSKHPIFEKNIKILHTWLDQLIFNQEQLIEEKDMAFSHKSKKLFLNFKLLKYKPNQLLYNLGNSFIASTTFITSPLTTLQVLSNFDNKNLEKFYKKHQQIIEFIEKIKTKPDDRKILEQVQKFGILLPLKQFTDHYIPFLKYIATPFQYLGSFLMKLGKKTNFLLETLHLKTPEFDIDIEKLFNQTINPHIRNKQIQDIEYLRNLIVLQNYQTERLQKKGVFFSSYILVFIQSKLQELLDNKLTESVRGIFFSIAKKTQPNTPIFLEEIMINDQNNHKLVLLLQTLKENASENKPLSNILISATSLQIQDMIVQYIYETLSEEVVYKFTVINPQVYTRFYLSRKQNAKPIEMRKMANELFHNNIKNLTYFLKIHFTDKEEKHMSFFPRKFLSFLKGFTKMQMFVRNFIELLMKPSGSIINVIEIQSIEILCGTRFNVNKNNNTNSMATSTFLAQVDGKPQKDKFILATTINLNKVDEAVVSRFFNVQIKSTHDIEFYVILVRRYLLENLKLIMLEKSLEEIIIILAYEYYREGYTGNDLKLFFDRLKSPEVKNKYGNKYNLSTIKQFIVQGVK